MWREEVVILKILINELVNDLINFLLLSWREPEPSVQDGSLLHGYIFKQGPCRAWSLWGLSSQPEIET